MIQDGSSKKSKQKINPLTLYISFCRWDNQSSDSFLKESKGLFFQFYNGQPCFFEYLRNRESNISAFEIILLLSIHRHHDVLLVANGVGGGNRTCHSW